VRNQLFYIALVTGASQLAAFVKLWLVARYFGVSADLDGYNLAFVLPMLISGVISGALQTGLFPVHARIRLQRGSQEVTILERTLFWWLFAMGGAISVMLLVSSAGLGQLLARDASADVGEAVVFVLRFSAFAVALNVMGDYLGFVLALRERFIIAVAAPIANALVGAGLLAAWPQGGLTNLAMGTLLGTAAQVAIVLWGAKRAGFVAIGRLSSWARKEEVWEIARLSNWMLPAVIFANITIALPQILVARFGEGAVSAFGYAFRLHQSMLQLLIIAASPVILASFSGLVVRGDWRTLARLQRKAFWLSMLTGVVALVVVGSIGESLLLWTLGYGRFDAEAAQRVAGHWFWLTCGFGIALYGNVLAKRIQAKKGAKVLSVLALAGTVSLIVVAIPLRPWLDELAIPIAVTTATAVPTLAMAVLLRVSKHSER
jgi:peptidoglycan biosynthesis protein MviN/MurJ (putative lipid II flippase)